MWYVIEGYDGAQVLERRMAAREQHLQRLVALRDAGRLLLAGPCPAIDAEDPGPAGFSGSLVVAEFGSLEEARAWAYCPELRAWGTGHGTSEVLSRRDGPAATGRPAPRMSPVSALGGGLLLEFAAQACRQRRGTAPDRRLSDVVPLLGHGPELRTRPGE